MSNNNLVKITAHGKKRLGQGHGSGKAKTGGKGTKGQNVRGKLPKGHSHYEGGQRSLLKRLPYLRGKGNAPVSKIPFLLSLDMLSKFEKGAEINLEFLVKNKIVKWGKHVKVVSNGQMTTPHTVNLHATKSAITAIEKAGGKYIFAVESNSVEEVEVPVTEVVEASEPKAKPAPKTSKVRKS